MRGRTRCFDKTRVECLRITVIHSAYTEVPPKADSLNGGSFAHSRQNKFINTFASSGCLLWDDITQSTLMG